MDSRERTEAIRRRIEQAIHPEKLVVEDEGHLHVGHAGARDGRGHFRVLVVADCFQGMSMIQRHRKVFEAVGELMKTDIHALAIEAWTRKEL